jgi:mono/diheme cytochrome c family protein
MPTDTLPADRGEPPMSVEDAAKLANPLTPTFESLSHGKDLFVTDCAPCHGESGAGNGPVVHLLKQTPKDLLSGEVKARSDGFIYGVIRDGFQLMPSYGDAMSSEERWQVVLYVRSLQQAGSPDKTAQK